MSTTDSFPHRIGLGYDAHAFDASTDVQELILGGVPIPYQRGLLGHSDADVLSHAISDALLSAAREGDIGARFPDTDPAFEGISSLILLADVGKLLRDKGWQIIDIDSVIIAQAPRLSPYRDAMRANIAGVLEIDISQVGVKATTTEHLGFEGRGEGIAAQAVVLLSSQAETVVAGGDGKPGWNCHPERDRHLEQRMPTERDSQPDKHRVSEQDLQPDEKRVSKWDLQPEWDWQPEWDCQSERDYLSGRGYHSGQDYFSERNYCPERDCQPDASRVSKQDFQPVEKRVSEWEWQPEWDCQAERDYLSGRNYRPEGRMPS